MGWTTGYKVGPEGSAREIVTRAYVGSPEDCASCRWREGAHPRVSGSEYEAIYGPSKTPLPAPHDFAPYVPVYRLLDYAATLTVAYLAVETIATGEVWAGVCLLSFTHGDMGMKELSEEMGPAEDRCPARILARLTPTDSDGANEWRARCRASLARREAAKAIKPGTRVRFARALHFSNGRDLAELEYVKGNTFREDWTRYTVGGWRTMDFEAVR
jgi:hypothetical protein